jgi:hypothetical protein
MNQQWGGPKFVCVSGKNLCAAACRLESWAGSSANEAVPITARPRAASSFYDRAQTLRSTLKLVVGIEERDVFARRAFSHAFRATIRPDSLRSMMVADGFVCGSSWPSSTT